MKKVCYTILLCFMFITGVNAETVEAPIIKSDTSASSWSKDISKVYVADPGYAASGIQYYEAKVVTENSSENTVVLNEADSITIKEEGQTKVAFRTLSINGNYSEWSEPVYTYIDKSGPFVTNVYGVETTWEKSKNIQIGSKDIYSGVSKVVYYLSNSQSETWDTLISKSPAGSVAQNTSFLVAESAKYIYFILYDKIGNYTVTQAYDLYVDADTPSIPEFIASDGVTSGNIHNSNFTLTAKVNESQYVSQITYYYGTDKNNLTSTEPIYVLSTDRDTLYYAKACNEANLCSEVQEYSLPLIWKPFVNLYTTTINGIMGDYAFITYSDDSLTVKVTRGSTTISTQFTYKNGIFSYVTKGLRGESVDEIIVSHNDDILLLAALTTLAEMKGYDQDNFENWLNTLDDETINSFTIENDGIEIGWKELNYEDETTTTSSTYLDTFKLDLLNGIKAYNPNIDYSSDLEENPDSSGSDNIFGEISDETNNENLFDNVTNVTDEDPTLPENPQTGSFVSIAIIGVAFVLLIGIGYIIKNKNVFYKI